MAMESSESSYASTSAAKVAVLVLVGLPGSGKTTLCFSLPHFLGSKYYIIHICYDQVIPFKEDMTLEENFGSWKDERSKVVQATEILVCNLIGAHISGSKKCTGLKETFLDEYKATTSINYKCFDKEILLKNTSDDVLPMHENTLGHIDKEVKQSKQNLVSRFNAERVVISNIGHYTILKSFDDIVSMHEKISECDLEDELFIICVDDNCYYRSMRKEWWNLAAKYELPFSIVTLDCEVEVCIRRVRERFHSSMICVPNVPETVIGKMAKHLEFPNGDLYPWEKHSIVIDSNFLNILIDTMSNSHILSEREVTLDKYSFDSLNRIKELINASLLEPAKPLNKKTQSRGTSVNTSIIHIADLALRKIVSKSDPSNRAQVNLKRKNILGDLRNGKLLIPNDTLWDLTNGLGDKLDEYMVALINLHY